MKIATDVTLLDTNNTTLTILGDFDSSNTYFEKYGRTSFYKLKKTIKEQKMRKSVKQSRPELFGNQQVKTKVKATVKKESKISKLKVKFKQMITSTPKQLSDNTSTAPATNTQQSNVFQSVSLCLAYSIYSHNLSHQS